MQYPNNRGSLFSHEGTSYLYDFLRRIAGEQFGEISAETIRQLGLNPALIEMSWRCSPEHGTSYYLINIKSSAGAVSHLTSADLPTLSQYHMSVYEKPYVLINRGIKKLSDVHLTIEYTTDYTTAKSERKPNTTHLYYEIAPSQTQINLSKLHETSTGNILKLQKEVIRKCDNIITQYMTPIVRAQELWFRDSLTQLKTDAGNLESSNPLLGVLLSSILIKEWRANHPYLHSTQHQRIPKVIPNLEEIIADCQKALDSNIQNLLKNHGMEASNNLQGLKDEFESAIGRLKSEPAYRHIAEVLQPMIQVIDLYQFNDFKAIINLRGDNRREFFDFVSDYFFDTSKILSFRNILRFPEIIQNLREFIDSLETREFIDSLETDEENEENDIIRNECRALIEKLEKFDMSTAIQLNAQKITTQVKEETLASTDKVLLDDIKYLKNYYQKLRNTLTKCYKKANSEKTITDEEVNIIKERVFLMSDFLKTPDSTDNNNPQQNLLSLCTTGSDNAALAHELITSYQVNPTGALTGLFKQFPELRGAEQSSLIQENNTVIPAKASVKKAKQHKK